MDDTRDIHFHRSREALYNGQSLLADPIHHYIPFTVPYESADEVTEKALIDSKWMQRLRYIYQLQSARWVYPSAEHSRFVHSIGAMHVAGRFAKHLYPSLKEVVPDAPSSAFIEALLRIAVLLHDVGHGPFCHFFDHNVLRGFGLTHEKLGQEIICQELGSLIQKIKRSPSGSFAPGESLDPKQVAFLIHKDRAYKTPKHYPRWLVILKPLLSGMFTADNFDYVLRDSFMCGISIGPVDINRLIHYSFFTPKGLTLHKSGLSALTMFLNARSFLYFNVYYHRTTRALDVHMRDIFHKTIKAVFPHNPVEHLASYADLTDWSLLLEVKSWRKTRSAVKRGLYQEWENILLRKVKWKMAYDTTLSPSETHSQPDIDPQTLTRNIRNFLPKTLKRIEFRVDIATQDPRPGDPLEMGDRQLFVYTPSTGDISKNALNEYVSPFPVSLSQCRIFALNHEHDAALSHAAEKALAKILKS
ncbi:dNTP triphosphohydrolase, broad substrate specificity [hydrothermal vent metagenome]|uniref:DNTP triphosphohydrolase, broad substrate specificity n=1 Tax=hydrothermal vent metagenome TaxID=652676 RepID=A0A3B1CRW2_9ZZZZ